MLSRKEIEPGARYVIKFLASAGLRPRQIEALLRAADAVVSTATVYRICGPQKAQRAA